MQIMNLKQFQRRNIITDVAGLIFFQNRDILYTVSTEAIISCPMKFSAYPLDYQVRQHEEMDSALLIAAFQINIF